MKLKSCRRGQQVSIRYDIRRGLVSHISLQFGSSRDIVVSQPASGDVLVPSAPEGRQMIAQGAERPERSRADQPWVSSRERGKP